MYRILLLIVSVFFLQTTFAQQDFSGVWTGVVTQKNKDKGFFYQLNLTQEGTEVSGTSISRPDGSDKTGKFEVKGIIENNELILQEAIQLEPKGEKWCLKHLRLTQSDNQVSIWLGGSWTAQGCTPGLVRLDRKGKARQRTTAVNKEEGIFGNWAGSLSQSDRDYGFYFEMSLQEFGDNTSYIVAEGNGGGCRHSMTYNFSGNNFQFSETDILKKDDPNWKWCIKNGDLTYRKEKDKHIMEGTWSGYIEGFDMETGPCASGTLYLEKPIIKVEETLEKTDMTVYEVRQKREVKIARIVEVKSPNLRIKVWDNGIVDGDILTLFLNGKILFDKHRVTKKKRGINVKLEEKTNLLVLHADDLGDIKPNTVGVSIDDGIKEQILILSSNLRESGGVMIKQFKME